MCSVIFIGHNLFIMYSLVFSLHLHSLAFSVTLFCSEALLVIVILMLRRHRCIGGELGGPVCAKYITAFFLVCLWLFYLVMSTLETYDVIEGF